MPPTDEPVPDSAAPRSSAPDGSGLRVASLQVSNGGVPKLAIPEARITRLGLEGDRQRNRKHHGGPDRAVCLYSRERIEQLRAEGHPIEPGSTGENVTLAGVPWERMVPGVRLRCGDATLEVVSYTVPCKTIRQSFADGRFVRISQELHPGWSRVYARVLEEGHVRIGDPVEFLR